MDFINKQVARKKYYYIVSAIAALVAVGWVTSAVLNSTNSTAAIGFLLIPPYAALFAFIGMGFLYFGYTIFDIATGRLKFFSLPLALSIIFMLGIGFYSSGYYLKSRALSIASNASISKQELNQIHQAFLFWGKEDVEVKLAQNPNCPEEILTTLSNSSNDYIVSQVGANPSTPLNILENIALGKLNYSRVSGLASNPASSPLIIERLVSVKKEDFSADVEYSLYRTFVLAAVARRENLSQNIFNKLADWPEHEYFLSTAVLNSDKISCEQIYKYQNEENSTLQGLVSNTLIKHKCP
ncbi:MAG: hypothetical protein ABL930_08670 [Pseudobdellovibrio sp.]